MDIRTALKDLVGRWQGSNQLWLSPDEPVRQSEGTADVHFGAREAFAIVRYTWADQGQPQDGLLAVRLAPEQSALDGVWIDSWHVGKTFMTLGGEDDRDGGLSLLGSYAAPTGPDWGWRIVISSGGPDELLVRMFNISPEGEVSPAVEARYARVSA